jgi:hypothetical protein
MTKKFSICLLALGAILPKAFSQKKDTTQPQRTVLVTAAFQPELINNGSKVNFSATAPVPDSSTPRLAYNIPSQNLFFSYQPAALKPMALQPDSAAPWVNHQYLKLGYGNFSTPYAQVGLSYGNASKTLWNLHGSHVSSKGSIPYQRFGKTGISGIGLINLPDQSHEITTKVYWNNHSTYQYGYAQPADVQKDSLRRQYNTIGAYAALRNKKTNAYNINYNPSLAFTYFGDNLSGKETQLVIDAPLTKSINQQFDFALDINASLAEYSSDSVSVTNNLVTVAPAVQYTTDNIKIHAGISPAWNNSSFNLLPVITAEAKLPNINFTLLGGFTGSFNRTTYQSLAGFNPWLKQPVFLNNTKVTEIYGGLRGAAGSHMNYSARASFLKYNNLPLFVNDTLTGRSFDIVNESSLKVLRLHGELGYTFSEKLSLLSGINVNNFIDLNDNLKAWGLPGLELTGTLRWQVLKDLSVKSDVFIWNGINSRDVATKAIVKNGTAVDLNLGGEFNIMPKLRLWLDFNNIFNNKYQRWNQYPVLGFNVVGGIIYSFGM